MLFPVASARAYDCVEKHCTKMSSCAEAHHHFSVCGESERDTDSDGILCENVCGTSLDDYRQRHAVDPAVPLIARATRLLQPFMAMGSIRCRTSTGTACNSAPPNLRNSVAPDMRSREEARFYLSSCGVRSLDRDGDGVPCESQCGG